MTAFLLPTSQKPSNCETYNKWIVINDQLVNICWKLLKLMANLLNLFICLELSMALLRTEGSSQNLINLWNGQQNERWYHSILQRVDWGIDRLRKKILLIFTPNQITLVNDFSEGDCYMVLHAFKVVFPLASQLQVLSISARHFYRNFWLLLWKMRIAFIKHL